MRLRRLQMDKDDGGMMGMDAAGVVGSEDEIAAMEAMGTCGLCCDCSESFFALTSRPSISRLLQET
jgi:hypothetical protein